MMKRIVIAVDLVIGAMVVEAGCGERQNRVVLWPGNGVIGRTTFANVDSKRQLEALSKADPKRDAMEAFKAKDYRFLADRPTLPRFWGVPDNKVFMSKVDRSGYEVVAFTDDLLLDENFLKIKSAYEERFNQQLYELVKAKHGDIWQTQ